MFLDWFSLERSCLSSSDTACLKTAIFLFLIQFVLSVVFSPLAANLASSEISPSIFWKVCVGCFVYMLSLAEAISGCHSAMYLSSNLRTISFKVGLFASSNSSSNVSMRRLAVLWSFLFNMAFVHVSVNLLVVATS